MPSGPASLCNFPAEGGGGGGRIEGVSRLTPPPSVAHDPPVVPFAHGHRRNASDTQAFQNMVHGKDNNPFLNSCTGEFNSIQEHSLSQHNSQKNSSQPQLQTRLAGWNPFEDQVSFGSMSEDNIFGAEFDQMRNPNGNPQIPGWGTGGGPTGNPPRRDPFGTAPFAAQGTKDF